jgi:hypothetical protein
MEVTDLSRALKPPHVIIREAIDLLLFSDFVFSIEGFHALCHPKEVTYLLHSNTTTL